MGGPNGQDRAGQLEICSSDADPPRSLSDMTPEWKNSEDDCKDNIYIYA